MKKIYTFLLVFFSFLLGFTACDDGSSNNNADVNDADVNDADVDDYVNDADPDDYVKDDEVRPEYGCPDVEYSDDITDGDLKFDADVDDAEPDEDVRPMYGCQYTTFSLNVTGDVKDADGNPIKDIKFTYNYTLEGSSKEAAAQSDENGQFVIADEEILRGDQEFNSSKLTVEDVDGELNGSFENRVIENVELNCYDDPEDGWDKTRVCEGTVSVTLDEKEVSDEENVDADVQPDEEISDSDAVNDESSPVPDEDN